MIKTYDTYKDSKSIFIGEIPNHWNLGNFRYMGEFTKGKLPSSSNTEGIGMPIIGATEMLGKDCRLFTENVDVPQCDKDDILILWDGANAGITSSHHKGVVSSTAVKYHCTNKNINKLYLAFLFKAAENLFKEKVNGTTIPHMNIKYINEIPLLIPPFTEQVQIASFLDKKCGEIDELLAVQEQMINELQAYKQSIITKAVTKGLNPNVLMEDSSIEWIGEIPNGWTICRFKNVAKVKANLVHPDNYLDMQQIAPDCIEKGSGKILKSRTVKEANVISDNHLFYKGQILYSKIRPTLNKVIIAPYDGLCCADMYPIETTLENKFCLYQMLSSFFYEQVGVVVQDRVKMPKINKEELDQITILVPPINEQKEIASYLDEKTAQIDSLIALKQEKITELKDYKKSIIYEYVTGKKKV